MIYFNLNFQSSVQQQMLSALPDMLFCDTKVMTVKCFKCQILFPSPKNQCNRKKFCSKN